MDFATDDARELFFYATTDATCYKQWLLPAYRNLERKWRKGTFDRLLAIKLFTAYALVSIGKQYRQEFGSGSFPPDVRQEVASHLTDQMVNELEIGNGWLS